MALFYLVRHGDIPFEPNDPALTPLGREQAAAVGRYLKDRGIQQVFTSPLLRARQTAEIIAQVIGLAPPFVDLRLRERMSWGDVADQNWAEFNAEWERASLDRDYVPLGGLSAHQAAGNMADFLRETALQFPTGKVAAVAHSGILSDYLIDTFTPAQLALVNARWPEHRAELITHCSITIIRIDEQGPRLEALGLEVVSPGAVG